MNTQKNSFNGANGCSVCPKGEERYTSFRPAHRPRSVFYQYDYRTKDGCLYSTVAPTLAQCRGKRDKWLQEKNRKRLSPSIQKCIEAGKRLTKSDMAFQIGHIEPLNVVAISWDKFSREEVVAAFNRMFGTEIK
jgi:hypothetical protein